jgi:division protein CdvB (Snf7/Vps24/ESCRT-III family)
LVKNFIHSWKEKEKQPSIVSRIKKIGQSSTSVKDQISLVTQRIDLQTKSLEIAEKRFETRDADIFNRVVKSISERDNARANILATELSEIRKIEKMLLHASLALESVSMRLKTVSEMGDIVTALAPAASVLNTVRSEMCTILPEAGSELGSIGNLLTDIVATTNQSTDVPVSVGVRVDSEAQMILEEAELAAEEKLKEQLPEITTRNTFKKATSIDA